MSAPQPFEHDGFNSPNEVEVAKRKAAQHTPGPWNYVDQEYGHDAVYGADGRLICHVFGDDAQAQGDAKLIAVAPELREACLAMVEWDDREKDHAVDFHARMALCAKAFDKARAAIAKLTEGTA